MAHHDNNIGELAACRVLFNRRGRIVRRPLTHSINRSAMPHHGTAYIKRKQTIANEFEHLRTLVLFHLEEHTSAQHLLQKLEEGTFVRNQIALKDGITLIARAESPLEPIKLSGDPERAMETAKVLIWGQNIMGIANTCLDPDLYGLTDSGAKTILFNGNLNELAPTIINREGDATLLDVPDNLIALEKWPGRFKIIRPISPHQEMACGFDKSSVELRTESDDEGRGSTFRFIIPG